jgi:hypothetical protein
MALSRKQVDASQTLKTVLQSQNALHERLLEVVGEVDASRVVLDVLGVQLVRAEGELREREGERETAEEGSRREEGEAERELQSAGMCIIIIDTMYHNNRHNVSQ